MRSASSEYVRKTTFFSQRVGEPILPILSNSFPSLFQVFSKSFPSLFQVFSKSFPSLFQVFPICSIFQFFNFFNFFNFSIFQFFHFPNFSQFFQCFPMFSSVLQCPPMFSNFFQFRPISSNFVQSISSNFVQFRPISSNVINFFNIARCADTVAFSFFVMIKCSICSYHQSLTRTPHGWLKKTIHMLEDRHGEGRCFWPLQGVRR